MTTKLTKREKVLLYILLIVIIITASVCLLILPGISKNADLAEEVSTLRMQKMEMESRISALDQKKAKVQELQQQYDELCEGLFTVGFAEEAVDAYIVAIAAKSNVIPDILTIENSAFAAPKSFLSQSADSSTPPQEKDQVDTSVYIVNVTIGGSAAMSDFEALVNAYSNDSHIIVTSAYTTQSGSGNNSYSITLQLYLLP